MFSYIVLIGAQVLSISAINVTIVSYGHLKNLTRTNVNNTVIGLDIAQKRLGSAYNASQELVQFHYVILTDTSIRDCYDAGANVQLVADYYYRNVWDDNNIMTMITPGCGDAFDLAKLAREWNVLMIGTSMSYLELRSRRHYPTYISVSAMQSGVIAQAVRTFALYYRWHALAALYDTQGLTSYFDAVEFLKWEMQTKTWPLEVLPVPFNSSAANFDPVTQLKGIRSRVRVIFLSLNASLVRTMMLAAKDLSMTNGEYVFLAGNVIISNLSGIVHWKDNDEHDTSAREAYRSLFDIRFCPLGSSPTDAFLRYLTNITQFHYGVTYFPLDNKPNEAVQNTYAVMEIYRQVIRERLAYGTGIADGAAVAGQFLNRTFHTSTGDVYLGSNGQSRSNMCLYDLDVNTGEFLVVLHYDARLERLSTVANITVDWPHGAPPPSFEFCSSCGNTTASLTWILAAVLSVVAVGCAVVFAVITRRLMCSIDLRSEGWMIDKSLLRAREHGMCTGLPENRKGVPGILCTSPELDLHEDNPQPLIYRNQLVDVATIKLAQCHPESKRALCLKTREQLKTMKCLLHTNICQFFGAFIEGGFVYLVSEHCCRGSLENFLSTTSIQLEWELVESFVTDIMEGIWAIHHSPLRYHGSLTLSNCLLDSRLTVKISQLGYTRVAYQRFSSLAHVAVKNESFLARALATTTFTTFQPFIVDIQRMVNNNIDLHAFGLVIEDIVAHCQRDPGIEQRLRRLREIAGQCTTSLQTSHRQVRTELAEVCSGHQEGYLVQMVHRLQMRAQQLENAVQDRTYHLLKEKKTCETLLLEMLPRAIVSRLAYDLDIYPESFDDCTVYFSHLYGFNEFVSNSFPLAVFATLNEMFRRFDQVTNDYHVYKMETVGDCYMVVSGVPERNGTKHAREICAMALALVSVFEPLKAGNRLDVMAGINSGACVAGIVGVKRPRYCLFGDTVNVAARLACHGHPGRIQVSVSTTGFIDVDEDFLFISRGYTLIKGRGGMLTSWLEKLPNRQV
ncbi:atrial natriuretic peptide receptor 1-like [Paramacrobiotus metropolitanus]|uniref:atrial natriuretic peptide receptor 1-like n=1 Tax=Paramacrobiotus metropolitanus TaxID=2943436 RepID=UPI0024464DB2|nr:atrial natriuretic peptide receptor 1-like [Paramacrobiotus metropolitanus]